jgi:non-ribosomal peptide synthetase component E (peptide arylation enzyme)
MAELAAGSVVWPADEVDRYRRQGIWGSKTIPQEFSAIAAARADADAVVTLAGTLSYADLDERTDRLAAALIRLGLERGERVLLQVDNRAETVILWYGLLKAGLVPVATLTLHRRHEIGAIAELTSAAGHAVIADDPKFDHVEFAQEMAQSNPRMQVIITIGDPVARQGTYRLEDLAGAVGADDARRLIAERQAQIDPDDVAVFQLSGGTTGTPKVIPRQHAEYWSNAIGYARRLGWSEQVRVAHVIPIVHNAGITCALHAGHSVGGALVLGALPDVFELFPKAKVTDAILGSGTRPLRQHPLWDDVCRHLERVILSGGKVSEETFEDFASRGIQAAQLFGMGEGAFLVTRPTDPRWVRNHTVGGPLFPEDTVEILVPETEQAAPDGVVGELCFRGSSTVRGYFDASAYNASAFTSTGALRTGDLARKITIDGIDGIAIEGRIKDLINRGGEKINAEEIEVLLLQHPRVLAAALVAMPDPRLGERACAYLVTAGGPLTVEEVGLHMESLGVAKYKWPERLEHVDQLPTTAVGKVSKVAMRRNVIDRIAAEQLTSTIETTDAAV